MNLHALLRARAEAGRQVRAGLIDAVVTRSDVEPPADSPALRLRRGTEAMAGG